MAAVKRLPAIIAALVLSCAAAASEPLWELLRQGGQVVMIRHALTTPGVGDPPGFRLDECPSQRNLTDEGRADAKRIGAEFRRRDVAVEQVLSSPWCRTLETAQLAFGKAEIADPLSNLFGRAHAAERQVKELRALLRRPKAGNLVMVTHGSTIQALAGINPAPGEMVILTPLGGGRFSVAGRLPLPR